eukprot:TRINITY_DN3395_c0_g2_i2.p1 TRINITY_DN3395_c0_g2~~TRINITY_DN3395_c0_g2_i2.p1  ORF type:complete len:167 (+),score=21.57 TRINITY_DN3395_c0_g2_i2:119-619(+)
MDYKLIVLAVFVLASVVSAQTCAQKKEECSKQCGGYDKMQHDCKETNGALSNSCACASMSGSVSRSSATSMATSQVKVEDWCYDIVPPNSSCEQQKKGNQCEASWMLLNNYCKKTCFGCECEDKTYRNSPWTCDQQLKWGKCNTTWMKLGRYCEKTCGRCGVPSST